MWSSVLVADTEVPDTHKKNNFFNRENKSVLFHPLIDAESGSIKVIILLAKISFPGRSNDTAMHFLGIPK